MSSTRIAVGIEYDGSQFCGWQMQTHGTRTVQHELQKALSKVADHPVKLTCAGRTDTGVHATAQVAHFDTTSDRQLKAWVMGSNVYLPDDINVNWAKEVGDDFSARFSARMRGYRYIILNRKARSALYSHQVSWIYDPLNIKAMHEAAQALLGKQDFSSFRSSVCQADHAIRIMDSISVMGTGDFIYIDVRANAFLHHMVRNIVGSLLMVGRGEQQVNWIAELLALKDRTKAGPTASAEGLYLIAVEYPPEYGLPSTGLRPQYS
jgi:tRNA pseudouridine38-40 synthase